MRKQSYSVTIAGNVERCRTEAEIHDETGGMIGVVYEDAAGWHTEVFNEKVANRAAELDAVFTRAIQMLSHYVNRQGNNPPRGFTVGALALRLMQKDDGTAMGLKIERSE